MAVVLGAAADAVAADDFGAARSAVDRAQASRRWPCGHRARRLAALALRRPAVRCPTVHSGRSICVDAPARLRGAIHGPAGRVRRGRRTSAAALDLVAARPRLRAVTTDGDMVGAGWVNGGSDRKPSTLEITSEIEKARVELGPAERQVARTVGGAVGRSGRAVGPAGRGGARAGGAQRVRCRDLGDLRAARPAGPGRAAARAEEEWQRLTQQREELETGRAHTVEELVELEARLHNAQQEPTRSRSPSTPERDRPPPTAAAPAEVEARLAVRTAEERANAVRGRADSLRRAAAAEREARMRAQRARDARRTPRRLRQRWRNRDAW